MKRLFFIWFVFFLCGGRLYSQTLEKIIFSQENQKIFGVEALQNHVQPFLGKEITQEVLLAIKSEIYAYFQANPWKAFLVEIPEQEITEGVVTINLIPAQVGKITFSGQKWFSEKLLKKNLTVQEGECIDRNQLLNDLSWLNQNPFHQTSALLSQGESRGKTNINYVTIDRFPFSFFLGVDNTGNNLTGHNRLFTGVNWGNAFWVDDLLSYQFTSSDDFQKFLSHFLNYTCFLPWRNKLVVYGGYSTIDTKVDNTNTKAKDVQASMRYQIPLRPLYTNFKQELFWGIDYKLFNSQLFFTSDDGTIVLQNDPKYAAIFQFCLGYLFEDQIGFHKPIFKWELYAQLMDWFPHQTEKAYDSFRLHAKRLYGYVRMSLGDVLELPEKAEFSWLLRAQGASGPLLPSEQFGLGGYNTVRGYNEREFLADQAICYNAELRMPPLVLPKVGKLRFLGFFDIGAGHNSRTVASQRASQTIFSAGPGARWDIAPYVFLRADYGIRLKPLPTDREYGKVHFSLVGRY